MALTDYAPSTRRWDHVGNLVPNFEHSEGIRPHLHGAPAGWLPVAYYDKWYETYITIMAGKLVALDRIEEIVPAGLKVEWAAAAGVDTILTYTAVDTSELVIDLTTGSVLTAAVSYTKTQVTAALRLRGLITSAEDCDDFVSKPIGVASHCMYAWAFYGNNESSALSRRNFAIDAKFANFYMQHKVAVLCDYALRIPHVPAVQTPETLDAALTVATLVFGSGNIYSAANTILATRYSSVANTDFIAASLATYPVAKNTTYTPLTADNASLLLRLRSNPDALTQAGDYYIDYEAGVMFFYVAGGATVPASVSGTNITFYSYATVPATVSIYVCAVGDIKPGSFLAADADSNFQVSASESIQDVMGQALTSVRHPRDFLDRVKTAWDGFGVLDQLPGTASGGYPDNITYAGGSDKEIVINLISR